MKTNIVAGALPLLLALTAPALAQQPKYYFQLREVTGNVDAALKDFVGEAVKKELNGHPEFTADLGGAKGEALVSELQKRNLKGFDMSVKIEKVSKDIKEGKPGSRFKVVECTVKLTLFGNTIPANKLAFSGEGEAGMKAEVNEKKVESEATALARDAANDAVKQAVDQGLARLSAMSAAQSGPKPEKARKPPKAKKK